MIEPDEGELAVDAVDVACEVGDIGCGNGGDVAAGTEFFAEVEEIDAHLHFFLMFFWPAW